MDEQENIAKQYDPTQVEDRLYSKWMEEDIFMQFQIKRKNLIQL